MRTFKILSILLACSMLLSGCDFFRSMLGKPTSEEINQIRMEKEAAAAAWRDSLARVKAAGDSLAQAVQTTNTPLDAKYYVMMGCFKIHDNAVNFKSFLERKGYTVYVFDFKNGYEAIAIYGSDDYADAYRVMDKTMETGFCPYDIWIYDASTNLHE